MNQQIGDRRLLKLAEFLKTVPRKRFDYARWVGNDWQGAPDLSCGTTACALGWATTMPVFRRLGLRLKNAGHLGWVTLGSDETFTAASKIFNLSESQAEYLFAPNAVLDGNVSPGFRATPKQVAKHIERFVRHRAEATP